MKGHDVILKTRMGGQMPTLVTFLLGGPEPVAWMPKNPSEDEVAGLLADRCEYPDVWIGDEFPEAADLRFVHGLAVQIAADVDYPMSQFRAWADAIAEAKPRILAILDPAGAYETWTPETLPT